ncbi:MAG TPA: hypothetical protein VFE60_23995 [Roseiarcus sp.]|jgi:hypothetical protein|nr:hypothetical protein [Roseiarcus sp.]
MRSVTGLALFAVFANFGGPAIADSITGGVINATGAAARRPMSASWHSTSAAAAAVSATAVTYAPPALNGCNTTIRSANPLAHLRRQASGALALGLAAATAAVGASASTDRRSHSAEKGRGSRSISARHKMIGSLVFIIEQNDPGRRAS